MMSCVKHPNDCHHATKDFETLKKHFPYFNADTLEELQEDVCALCKSEWHIPRFQ